MLITISHDRHFLNEICTHIADIDYETIITYPGGYDDMVDGQEPGARPRRAGERRAQEEDRAAAGLRRAVRAPARAPRRCRAARSRSRSLQLADLKRSNIERPFIQFLVKKPSGKQTLTIEGLTKRWPERRRICDNFNALVTKGEKIAIIGKSGVGKTTLCKHAGRRARSPTRARSSGATRRRVGYLAQDHRDGIPNGTTVDDWLHSSTTRAEHAGHPRPARARCCSRAKRA